MNERVKHRNEHNTIIVLKVLERDGFGRPIKCEMGYDDTTFALKSGDEFITAYVTKRVTKPKTQGTA